jgi:hypothetical protein
MIKSSDFKRSLLIVVVDCYHSLSGLGRYGLGLYGLTCYQSGLIPIVAGSVQKRNVEGFRKKLDQGDGFPIMKLILSRSLALRLSS